MPLTRSQSLDGLCVDTAKTSPEQKQPFNSQKTTYGVRASQEVGDNREPLTMTAPPSSALPPCNQTGFSTPQDKFTSNPEDPWHLTYTELNAMRTRMQTLERLETATNNFTLQMQAIVTRTSNLESKTERTSSQLTEVRSDLSALKKTVQDSDLSQTSENIVKLQEELSSVQKIILDSKIEQTSTQLAEVREEVLVLKKTVQEQQELISSLKNDKEELAKIKVHFDKTSQQNISQMNKFMDQQKNQLDSFKSTAKNLQRDIKKDTENQIVQVKQDIKSSTKNLKRDIKNDTDEQIRQVKQDVKTSEKNLLRDVKKETEEQILQVKHDVTYTVLKGQAFQNRFNIIVIGLPEHPTNSTYTVTINFFKTQLKLNKLNITSALRLGPSPPEHGKYIRPIVVTFATTGDRNSVWKKRNNIPPLPRKNDSQRADDQHTGQQASNAEEAQRTDNQDSDYQQKIRIKADLPKQLRDDANILYKVLKAAERIPEFQTASIKDYALHLFGKVYSARQLEHLPYALRPSTLAIRKTDSVLAFFSRSCPLSNHYPSEFTIGEKTFYNVEQFLSFKKANLAQNDHLVQKALATRDPVEAKAILNTLRHDNVEDWQRDRAGIALEAIRAKFTQSKHLRDYLCNTRNMQLGEASKNPCWGVGMTLEDAQITNTEKWSTEGNLLGKTLMAVREELISN